MKNALRPRLMKDIALRGITNSGGEIEAEFELDIKEDNLDKFRSVVNSGEFRSGAAITSSGAR